MEPDRTKIDFGTRLPKKSSKVCPNSAGLYFWAGRDQKSILVQLPVWNGPLGQKRKIKYASVLHEYGYGSISKFRTHKYHKIARNFETNPMGPVTGSETHIS